MPSSTPLWPVARPSTDRVTAPVISCSAIRDASGLPLDVYLVAAERLNRGGER